MADSKVATTYPTESQYERWKAEAEEMGMSTSEFMTSMIEAGLKKFQVDIDPDETNQELRDHRNELKNELRKTRKRVENLEERAYSGERAEVQRRIEDNPGMSYAQIVQKVIDTAPERVNRHLDELEGEEIENRDGSYYPIGQGEQ